METVERFFDILIDYQRTKFKFKSDFEILKMRIKVGCAEKIRDININYESH